MCKRIFFLCQNRNTDSNIQKIEILVTSYPQKKGELDPVMTPCVCASLNARFLRSVGGSWAIDDGRMIYLAPFPQLHPQYCLRYWGRRDRYAHMPGDGRAHRSGLFVFGSEARNFTAKIAG